MATLVTGGTGFLGAALSRLLVSHGIDLVIFDRTIKRNQIEDIFDKVTAVQGDLGNWAQLMDTVKHNNISHIYHFGAMLNSASRVNPRAAFEANVGGTRNVLEAALLFDIEKVVFSSSAATYGLELGPEINDTTIQRPTGFYGVTKLFGEGMGRFYRDNYGLDFRSLRYFGVAGPGDRTLSHWGPRMIEAAALGKPFQCFVTESSAAPMMFIKDAVRAAEMLMSAPKKNIKTVNYNIKAVANASAREVEESIRKYVPDVVITYEPDPAVMANFKNISTVKDFNDSSARQEWGWNPEYQTVDQVVSAFLEEVKAHSERYR